MSDEPETFGHALQDYLDGRLSPDERSAFEDRLEREPELRLELKSALELRAALGEESPALSPGFYTRTRARFEESRRSKRLLGFRLVSWETAGLAAAAALATALFVPRLMQQGVPADLGAVEQETRRERSLDDVKDEGKNREPARAPAAAPEAKEGPSPAPAPSTQEAVRQKKGREATNVAQPGAQPGLADAEGNRREQHGAPTAGDVVEADEAEVRRRVVHQETLQAAPSKTSAPQKPSSGKGDRRAGRDDAFYADAPVDEIGGTAVTGAASESAAAPPMELHEEVARGERGKRAVVEIEETRPRVVELRAGLAQPGTLRTVDRLEDWTSLLAGAHGETLAMLGSPTPDRRLVLIGAREGLACDALTVASTDEVYRIEAASTPTDQGAPFGCALVLPLDGRGVSVAGPR